MLFKNTKYILTVLSLLVCFELAAQTTALSSEANQLEQKAVVESDSEREQEGRARRRFWPFGRRSKDADTTAMASMPKIDSVAVVDSTSLAADTLAADTAKKSFLDDIITGKNQDSLVYDVTNRMVYIYEKGDISYQNMNLQADYMRVDMNTRDVYAHGREDTVKNEVTHPQFQEGESTYTMDTINYNFKTKKAKIKGVSTKEGEGFLQGKSIKKMQGNTFNIANGRYTTCDAEHPHFYIAISKGKYTTAEDGKQRKVVVGPSYMVFEDVPLYFLGLPFGFFPMSQGRSSGFIIPSYGEETVKGFFIRDGGYYFAFNDYIDMTLLGGYYTLGSWEASVQTRYTKKYRYNGSFQARFSKDIIGEKGAADYVDMDNFNITWSHQQDPKFRPNSTFAASVNFSTSGYAKYGADNMSDYLNTQTNSSVSYSHRWEGKPYSISMNLQHSQNSRDTTISLSLPNVVFNVSRIFPFRRKEMVGKERWYEKISLSYTATLANNVTVKEDELFSEKMFKEMRNGVNHQIPISMSFNLFNYINFSPNMSYNERWYFKKIEKEWNPTSQRVEVADTTYGFYRVYDYSISASLSTKVYGMFTVKKKDAWLKAVRHMMTPNISISYRPDFGAEKYGYYKQVQSNSRGDMTYYSPFEGAMYGVPGRGKNASMSFGLQNTLEMKIRSDEDTSGVKKIKLIDNLSFNGSYNFMADSMNLSNISVSFRTTLTKNFGLNVSAVLDPYCVNSQGVRYNKIKLPGRVSSASTSFGYSFNSSGSGRSAVNDINSQVDVPTNNEMDLFGNPEFTELDPNTRRQILTSSYYDFNIPWNFGFNYSLSYTNNGIKKNVFQTLGFNGSINLTPKWGIAFNGGYDFEMKKLTPGTFSLSRDLHCWQMSFSWVPIGYRKSWSFNISAKSAMLQDLKYDKNSSFYDNLYDY